MTTRTVAPIDAAADVGRTYGLTGTGLRISRELTRAEWLAVGGKLLAYASAIQWAIGDWVIYGEDRAWGATSLFSLAQWKTKRSYESILQCANVARAFSNEARGPEVSWSHYREALRLPKDDRLGALREAAREGWSRNTFAQAISDRMTVQVGELMADGRIRRKWPARAKQTHITRPMITCPSCGFKWATKRDVGATTETAEAATGAESATERSAP